MKQGWQPTWFDSLMQSQSAKQRNIATIQKNQILKIAKQPDMAVMYSDPGTSTATSAFTVETFDIYNTTASNMYVTTTGATDTWVVSTNQPTGTYVTQQAQQQYVPPAPPPQPQPDPRILNRFLNAADLLEEFIKDLAPLGVKQGEALQVPIEMFINWLICKAADEDGHDAPDDIPALPSPEALRERSVHPSVERGGQGLPRCLCCGRFIAQRVASAGVSFCNGSHADKYLEKIAA